MIVQKTTHRHKRPEISTKKKQTSTKDNIPPRNTTYLHKRQHNSTKNNIIPQKTT